MDAIVTRARTLLRQHVRATVALALIAGLGAGAALAFWSAARRSSSSFDRFLEADGQPDFLVSFCAPDATREEIESETGCPHYGARSEAATIRKMRGVRAVSRGSSVFGTYELRGSRTPGFIGTLIDDHDLATFAGRPKVTAGRLADPAVAHEIVVPEELAALYDLRVGDTAGFTATPEDPDRAPDATRLEVVGIVRTPADLVARLDPEGATFSNSLPLAGPAFWTRFGKQAQSWGTLVLVRVDHMEKQAFGAALRQRFPGRDFSVESARELEAERHADEAIGYETSVLYVATLVAAAAFLLFTGQALVRQSIREDADADTLVALGMTRRQLLGASALRATPAAAIAIVVAIFVAVISSAWSPTSVAAAAEVGNGFRFDAVVMLVGAAILGGVMVFGLSLATVRRAHDRSPSTVGSRFRRFRQTLPPAPRVGFSFVASPHHRTLSPLVAVGTVALAVALAIVGPGLAASLHDLVDHPRGYGTTWDLTLTGQGDPFLAGESFGPARRAVRAAPEVTAAAGLNVNNEGVIGGRAVPIVAFWPLAGPPRSWPVITAGRAPKARGEVALGAKTMDALGLSLGERTNLRMDPGKEPRRVAGGERRRLPDTTTGGGTEPATDRPGAHRHRRVHRVARDLRARARPRPRRGNRAEAAGDAPRPGLYPSSDRRDVGELGLHRRGARSGDRAPDRTPGQPAVLGAAPRADRLRERSRRELGVGLDHRRLGDRGRRNRRALRLVLRPGTTGTGSSRRVTGRRALRARRAGYR